MYVLVLSLPIWRGYEIYGWFDTLTHIGFLKEILSTNHISFADIYPSTHLLETTLKLILNIDFNLLIVGTYIAYFLVYIFGVILLSRWLCNSDLSFAIMCLFLMTPMHSIYHTNIHPAFLSLSFLPYILCLTHKKMDLVKNNVKYVVLILVLSINIVFTHPTTTIFLVIILASFIVSLELKSIIYKNSTKYYLNKLGIIVLIIFISFFVWYFSFPVIKNSFEKVANLLINGGFYSKSLIVSRSSEISNLNMDFVDLIVIFIKRNLVRISYFTLSAYFIVRYYRTIWKSSYLSMYCFAFVFTIILNLIMIISYFVEQEPIRVFRVAILISGIFNCLAIIHYINYKKIFSIAVIGIFIFIVNYFNINSVYASPNIFKPNFQLTKKTICGIRWLGGNQGEEYILFSNLKNLTQRTEDYIYGISQCKKKIKVVNNKIDLKNKYFYAKSLMEIKYKKYLPQSRLIRNYEDFDSKQMICIYNNGGYYTFKNDQ